MIAETETLRCLSSEAGAVSFLIEDFRWNLAHKLADLKQQSDEWCGRIAQTFAKIAAIGGEMIAPARRVAKIADVLALVTVVEFALLVVYARKLILDRK
jgi:hypothetical protein